MLSKESTPTMLNKATGSAFFILKENQDLRCGLRIWVDGSPARLCFRMRVEAMPSFTSPNGVLKDYLTATFPGVVWSTVSSSYASIVGSADTTIPLGDPDGFLAALTANDIPAKIYDCLIDRLRSMEFDFDREEFEAFVWTLIVDEISKLKNSTQPNKDLVTFNTPDGAQVYESGIPVKYVNGSGSKNSPKDVPEALQGDNTPLDGSEPQHKEDAASDAQDAIQSL